MTPDELLAALRARGHEAEMRYLNGAGKMVYLVDDVAMFYHDADDLLRRRATMPQIIGRNVGADLGWTYPDERR